MPLRDLDEVHHMFGREQSRAALVIPPNFSETIVNGKEVRLGLLLDGSDTTLSTSTEGFLTAIVTTYLVGFLGLLLVRAAKEIQKQAA